MLVAYIATRSCGLSLAVDAIATTSPAERGAPVVAELDPHGGDRALRLGVSEDVGIFSLAAALGRLPAGDSPAPLLAEHCVELASGVRLLAGTPRSRDAGAALDCLVDQLPVLARDLDILADCGRLDVRPPSRHEAPSAIERLVAAADLVVVLVRPELAALVHLGTRMDGIRALNRRVGVLLNGSGPYGLDEVARDLAVDGIGHLPHDPTGAGAIAGGQRLGTWTSRLALPRAARSAALEIERRAPSAPLRWQPPATADLAEVRA